jgi:ketosteroid isomerase-like protein
MTETREVAEQVRRRLEAMDMAGFADLLADDVHYEYPFGFPGSPSEFHGRAAVAAHLVESRRDIRDLIEISDVAMTVYETTDPEVVIFETLISGTTLNTGRPFRFTSGVGVLTVRGGKIVHYRDYTNVLGAVAITGGAGAIVESLVAQAGQA